MKKKILSATLIYGVLTFLQPLTSFLLLPIYLQIFDADEYGILSLMNNYTNLLGLIGALGIGGAFVSFFFDYYHNEERLKKFLGQVLSFSFYTTLLLGGLLLIFGGPLFRFIFKSDAIVYYPYGFLATLTGLLMCIEEPFRIYLRNKKELLKYTGIVLCNFILTVVVQLILILVLDYGIKGALIGRLTGVSVNAMIVVFWSRKHLTFRLDWRYLIKPLRFIKFLLPGTLLRWIYVLGDRFIIERLLTLVQVGLYSLLSNLVHAVEMVYFALLTAILPYLSEAYVLKGTERTQKLATLYNYYLSLTILAIFGVIMLVGNIHFVVSNQKYLAIQQYANILALGYLFSSFNHLLYYEFYFYKDSKTVLKYAILSVTMMVGLNLLLLAKYQLWGVVLASLISRVCVLIVLFLWNKEKFVPFQNRRIYASIVMAMTLIAGTEILIRYYNYSLSLLSIGQFGIMLLSLLFLNKNFRRER